MPTDIPDRDAAPAARPPIFSRIVLPVLGMIAVIAIAFSWLVFPYTMSGDDMLYETGSTVKSDRVNAQGNLTRYLSRLVLVPGGTSVKALYAPDEYFEFSSRGSAMEEFRPDQNFVFFIWEDVHTEDLPKGLPSAYLDIGGEYYFPETTEGPEVAEHHRLTIVSFSRFDEAGRPITGEGADEMKLVVAHEWLRSGEGLDNQVSVAFGWPFPLEIPEELRSRDTFTTAMLFSLSAGLLAAVLTPCLLQLAVIFLATLGGLTAQEAANSTSISPEVRRKVFWAAGGFVIGYVLLFTASGALIGAMGKEAQLWFAVYSRPVAIGSGFIVIAFGLWMGIRARAPMMCRIPGSGLIEKMKARGPVGAIIVSIAFSLGCMSCFGGAIIGTLFIYVGALGSPSAGAAVMGLFAAGVAVPFMLAALFFTRMQPLFALVSRHSKSIGLVGSLVMILFGIALITDNFHTLSDAVYPYLGLS
ncbi:cytochrome c biogenesis CcdA family protein [Tropicimonas sp. TH_r6]|uniref:cytochrome c biogenesis CcdA family protein n=1 Tax=Tropicimonas sp. TH_r6 TaxID=3082085 RepID=UPI002953DABA|nr:cytochrome c biogenesis CcdA family protein [Tropicimonas sp. TH_r6]MDV7143598.1 cytochrome c biogenesis CcdA family protein [Tropicimonas sp. TH_r6]